jgi:hypothetical protein
MPYRQCELKRIENGKSLTTVSYIPSKLAKVGRKVEVQEDKNWTPWTVDKVSETEISDEVAKKTQKMWHAGWNNNI